MKLNKAIKKAERRKKTYAKWLARQAAIAAESKRKAIALQGGRND